MKEHSVLEINVWNAKESGPLIKHLLSANMSLVLSGKLDQRAYNKLPCQEMCVIQVSWVHSPWFEIFEKNAFDLAFYSFHWWLLFYSYLFLELKKWLKYYLNSFLKGRRSIRKWIALF